MKISRFLILYIILVFSLPYIYGGCVFIYSSGDIDKNEENNGNDSSIGCVGINSQAAINATNAEELTGIALAGGSANIEPKGFASNQVSNDAQSAEFLPLRLPLVLGDSLRRIELKSIITIFRHTDFITESSNFDGSCGGNFSYNININKVSEKFSGSLTFEDYCEQGINISGKTDVEGEFDGEFGDIETATFTFEDLTDGFLTIEGDIAMDFTDSPIIATFNAYSTDDSSGDVYWIKDYSMNITELIGNFEIDVFGTFYHPDHGFVYLTTSETFVVHDDDDWPTSGQIVIQGDKNTRAQLTAIDHIHFGIEADTNGNGIFNWDSGFLNWNDL